MTALKPYPSSLFETFKRLGYRTRLFYGGYLSWQRFGEFARDQGVEEVYGAPHMRRGAATHEWGVDDEYLLDFVADTVADDRPSFNLIMTTSYHPPYNVDVWGKGFPLRKVPDDIAPMFDDTTSLTMLGHLWYSDKCLGEFVKKEEGRLSQPLFAFTGDHFGRKFINAKPEFFERSGVPFILYGSEVLRGIDMPKGAAGAHIDIGPTLIELAAPKGFAYYSVGQDLLFPRKEFLGIGFFRVIGKDFILDVSGPPKFHPLPGTPLPKNLPDMNELKATFNRTYGIGWWRVRQGAKL
jgi:phosphoglycerol transferase MdoB-like AlkP superfamily enzyme